MQFDLFSAHSFEQMVQSLCVPILGSGVVIFGSGPDGGREATYTGEVPFPSEVERWNGYIVVQAKCREHLRHTANDSNWLVQQLRHDLEKFLDKDRALKMPEYYILATNVTLSSVEKKGGKAKVEATFRKYAKRLGLKGYFVLAADELRVHLENSPEVRKAYTAWLTPSDVLASLIDSLKRPVLSRLAPLALARDMRNERDVRLRDAGQETETPVFLEDVFVDLPVTQRSQPVERTGTFQSPLAPSSRDLDLTGSRSIERTNGRKDSEGDDEPAANVAALLLSRASDKLDCETLSQNSVKRSGRENPLPNRIVLLGGPGQGKSTMGQFVVQIARARLLKVSKPEGINPQTLDLIDPVLNRARTEGIPLDGPCRFPFRVDLPSFADELSSCENSGKSLSLLKFMSNRLSRDIDVEIGSDDLRTWVGTCPCLIVLDGLDEVPPSANRKSVVRAIDSLWDDLHHVSSDAFVVVTTRPQGYNRDLDDKYWQHWELSPLSTDVAVSYGVRLAKVRLSDPDRQQEIIAELRSACTDPATKLLAISPLQVAILFGIALLKGVIPQDRWELFDRYYTLLRDREAQKPGTTAATLRDYKRQIDSLHHYCGFVLQARAEISGSSSAFLTLDEFTKIIVKLLEGEGFDKAAVDNIARELARIATERLVLLASKIEGRIAFDVRSLQEYMAAAQLTSVSNVSVDERLRQVASSAHWRHVLRIAASKIFSLADLGHLRDDVLAICHALDNGDLSDDARRVKAGAKLALDLVADGTTSVAPNFQRHFVRRALQILDLGERAFDPRLALFFSCDTEEVYRVEIISRVKQGRTPAARAAWALLFLLMGREVSWVESLMISNWPRDNSFVLELFSKFPGHQVLSSEVGKKVHNCELSEGFARWREYANRIVFSIDTQEVEDDKYSFILPRVYLGRPHSNEDVSLELNIIASNSKIRGYVMPLEGAKLLRISGVRKFPTGKWAPIHGVNAFLEDLSKSGLARAIEILSKYRGFESANYIRVPWPLETAVREVVEGADPVDVVREANAGAFGDTKDWLDAEERWAAQAIGVEDFLQWNSGRYIGADIADVGVPFLGNYLARGYTLENMEMLVDIVEKIDNQKKKFTILKSIIISIYNEDRSLSLMSLEFYERVANIIFELHEKMSEKERQETSFILSIFVGQYFSSDNRCVDWLDWVGRRPNEFLSPNADVEGLLHEYSKNPSKMGLVSVLAEEVRSRRYSCENMREFGLNMPQLHSEPGCEPIIRARVADLRVRFDVWSMEDIPWLVDDLCALGEQTSGASLSSLFRWDGNKRRTEKLSLLRSLCDRLLEAAPAELMYLNQILAADLDSRKSPLTCASVLRHLGLPSVVEL